MQEARSLIETIVIVDAVEIAVEKVIIIIRFMRFFLSIYTGV